MGRSPEWDFGREDQALTRTVEVVRDRGRLQLPPSARGLLGDGALAILREPGRLRLVPWAPHGPQIERALAVAYANVGGDDDALDELLDVADRHDRLHVDADGRIQLNKVTLFHLGVELGRATQPSPDRERAVLVWVVPSAAEVWSRDYRKIRRSQRDL